MVFGLEMMILIRSPLLSDVSLSNRPSSRPPISPYHKGCGVRTDRVTTTQACQSRGAVPKVHAILQRRVNQDNHQAAAVVPDPRPASGGEPQ